MQRWMHRAAGGTSQRLKPGLAMIRSRERSAGEVFAAVALAAVMTRSPPNADLGHGSKAISLTSSCSRYYPHSSGPPANRSRGRSGDYKVRGSSTSASDDSNSGDDSDSTQREQLREVPPERLQFPLSEQPVMDRKQRSRSVRLKSSIVYEASFVLPPSEC